MSLPGRTPPLVNPKIIANLLPRQGTYWNTLEYCRHIGVKKYISGECYWTAQIVCRQRQWDSLGRFDKGGFLAHRNHQGVEMRQIAGTKRSDGEKVVKADFRYISEIQSDYGSLDLRL